MPNPGTANNPSGVNSFDHFAPEPPYGEVLKQKQLQQGAPLAGGKVAAGKISAPKQAQAQAETAAPVMPPPPPPMTAVDVWRQIASAPGAEQHPLLGYYASRAT